jgi:hypothetical protein
MSRRPRIGENTLVVWALTTLLVTIIVAGLAWAHTALVFGPNPNRSLVFFFAATGLVSGAVTAIMMLINRPGPETHAAPPSPNASPAPIRFLDRLPEKLKGGTPVCEDHYLRLHTSKGSDLILMRLADAIAELEGIEGAQTHRSWWVAKDAIAEVKRNEGRVALALKNGTEAPVSRPNVSSRESGWLYADRPRSANGHPRLPTKRRKPSTHPAARPAPALICESGPTETASMKRKTISRLIVIAAIGARFVFPSGAWAGPGINVTVGHQAKQASS